MSDALIDPYAEVKRRENIFWIALVLIANPRPGTDSIAVAQAALLEARRR